MTATLTTEQLALLAQCDGKHNDMQELFNCSSCELLLEMDTQS
jgi:hypothetical protein